MSTISFLDDQHEIPRHRPRRRKPIPENPLREDLAASGSFAWSVKDAIILGLMNARFQVTSKDMKRHVHLTSAEQSEDNRKIQALKSRRDAGESLEIVECLDFLSLIQDDDAKGDDALRKIVPRVLTLVVGFTRKQLNGRPGTKGLFRKYEEVESYARLIQHETDPSKLRKMASADAVAEKLTILLRAG